MPGFPFAFAIFIVWILILFSTGAAVGWYAHRCLPAGGRPWMDALTGLAGAIAGAYTGMLTAQKLIDPAILATTLLGAVLFLVISRLIRPPTRARTAIVRLLQGLFAIAAGLGVVAIGAFPLALRWSVPPLITGSPLQAELTYIALTCGCVLILRRNRSMATWRLMTHPDLQRATGPAAAALDVVTRIGFAAKGIVTILVGVLALRFALRRGGEITGQQGAVELVLREPFGRLMLAALAAGLAAYALWMFVAAFVDPERKGESFQGIAERLGFFATGIGYTLLASTGFSLLLGRKGGGGLDRQHVIATVLTPHVGRVLVGLAGLIVMTAGALQLRLGVTGRFRKLLRSGMTRLERLVTGVSGRVGYVTLGILSLIAGWSLVEVAVEYDPSDVRGRSEALWLLSGLGRGRWLLAAAALGLICYGLYFVLQVRYRRL